MTQYSTLNVKFSTSQLNKLRSEIKLGTEITLKISWNVVGYSNDEITFPHMSPHKLDLIMHKFQSFVKLLQIIHQPL